MASLKGTILIAGTNGGLGTALVSQIVSTAELASNYHGIYTVRKVETATALSSVLASAPQSHKHDKIALDLSKLSDVRNVAARINTMVAEGSIPPICALIWNAAYQEQTTQTFTVDGFDTSFQCCYLSHWLLTLLLLQSIDKEHGRIVILGSSTHDPNDSRNGSLGFFAEEKWKTIFHDTDSIARGTWSSTKEDPSLKAGFRRYGAAKLCEVMMIYELQRRLDADPALHNISVLGVDPGGMTSGLTRRGNFFLSVIGARILVPIMASLSARSNPNGPIRTTTKSGGDVLRAAFDKKTLGERPKAVYLNGTDPWEASAEARDPKKQQKLWESSVRYAGLRKGDTILANLN